MSQAFKNALIEHNKFIKEEIQMIDSGAKLSNTHRELKPKEKELRKQLANLLKHVAKTGEVSAEIWPQYKNYLAILIKETLDKYNAQYKDSKSFDEEKEVILQYIIYFERAPFTIQRLSELTMEPEKYYKSCKKILYAYQKLVNVSDPEDR